MSTSKKDKILELKGRRNVIEKERAKLKGEMEEILNRQNELFVKINDVNYELQNIETTLTRLEQDIIVSNNALLTYFEVVKGYNLKNLKSILVTPEIQNYVETLGSGIFPWGSEGHKVKIQNGTLMHFIPKEVKEDKKK